VRLKVPAQRKLIENRPVIIGLAGAGISLIATFVRGINETFQNDATGYVNEARGMLEGWTFMQVNPSQFGHGFGFTGTIFLTFLLSGSTSLFFIKIILALGHGASSFLVAKIGQQIGLRAKFWIAAALIFSVDPLIILAATDVQTESLTTLIVLWWCYIYISHENVATKNKTLILSFTVTGIFSVLMRPNSLLPFLFVAFILYRKWRSQGVERSIFTLSTLIFLGAIALYQLFLFKLYSGFIFLSTAGAANAEFMCRKEFIPQYLGFVSAAENERINSIATQSTTTQNLLSVNPNLTIPELNREYTNLGITTCLDDPIGSISVVILKIFALWRPFTVFGAYGAEVFVFSLLLWVPLTLITIWFLFNKNRNSSTASLQRYFVVMALGFTLSLVLTTTQIRHRVAIAEPFFWIFLLFFVQRFVGKIIKVKD